MKKSRPVVNVRGKYRAGLTSKEIVAWFQRVALIKTTRNFNLFSPESIRWRGSI